MNKDRIAIDSNILIYASLEPNSEKGRIANQSIVSASVIGIIAAQSLCEYIAVVRRRKPDLLAPAIAQAEAWAAVFDVAPTTRSVVSEAFAIVQRHDFQVWDAIIWSASAHAGATVLLTEDLQHGFARGGLRALNPFELSSSQREALFTS